MRKGSRVVGDACYMKDGKHETFIMKHSISLRYHLADRGGRMYLCGCIKWIRINGKEKWCGCSGRNKQMQKGRMK